MKNVFLAYNLENDQKFVEHVKYYLSRQPNLNIFFYDRHEHGDDYNTIIPQEIKKTNYFVFFHGSKIGLYQIGEALEWLKIKNDSKRNKSLDQYNTIIVELPNPDELDQNLFIFHQGIDPLKIRLEIGENNLGEKHAMICAADIARSINGKWIPYDGIPDEYIFKYEKNIIDQFVTNNGIPEEKYLKMGCPDSWPQVCIRTLSKTSHPNPLKPEDIGEYRHPEETILVDLRSKYHHICNGDVNNIDQPSCLIQKKLTFLEAGPRQDLFFGYENPLKVGILVAGGIAPGINAVISGLVDRHIHYWREHFLVRWGDRIPSRPVGPSLVIYGFRDGFSGLLQGRYHRINIEILGDDNPQKNKDLEYVMKNANSGGSMFGTSRCDDMTKRNEPELRNKKMDEILSYLWHNQIDILYIIGGDGSMKAAHALHVLNEEHIALKTAGSKQITIAGIPKTMDNDILWVWQSFGFMSAVEKASECIRLLHTEAISNPRLCIIQLFGSDSGFTVSHAALASLQCDAALIPEIDFNMTGLYKHISQKIEPRNNPAQVSQESPFGIIIMAETAVPIDWHLYIRWNEYLKRISKDADNFLISIKDEKLKSVIKESLEIGDESNFRIDLSREEIDALLTFVYNGRRVYGQTPDPLRTASLKLVSRVLEHLIQEEMGQSDLYWKSFRVFTNEPRHLLRSSPPSANDIISGRRFGILAVDNTMAGYSDFMISQWLTEYVLVPLSLVVLGRKRVPDFGIFWKSVLAKTEQPKKLLSGISEQIITN